MWYLHLSCCIMPCDALKVLQMRRFSMTIFSFSQQFPIFQHFQPPLLFTPNLFCMQFQNHWSLFWKKKKCMYLLIGSLCWLVRYLFVTYLCWLLFLIKLYFVIYFINNSRTNWLPFLSFLEQYKVNLHHFSRRCWQ